MDIRRAATPRGRVEVGAFVIEGTRLFERAIRADSDVLAAIHSDDFASGSNARQASILAALLSAGVELFALPTEKMTELTAGRKFGAIIGLVGLPQEVDISTIRRADGRSARLLVAIDVEDPGNVGALMRTALATGADAMLTTGVSDPFHPRAIRTSMGAVFRLPLARASKKNAVDILHTAGFQTVATVTSDGTDIRSFHWPNEPVAILMGSEAHALPPAIVEAAHHRLTIPMAQSIDSFSVNAATAIVMHDAMNCAE